MSSSASSSITSTTSSKVMTPTSRSSAVDHRRGHQIVALEQPRHFLLVLVGMHAPALGLHQIGNWHRPLAAQQPVERHRAEKTAGLVGHVKFVEVFRQLGGLAHIVDRLADIPRGGTAMNSVCICRPAESSG